MLKNKTNKVDYLYYAFQNFLSDSPDGWSGQQLYDYIEQNCDDDGTLVSDDKITFWEPFDNAETGVILDAVESLAEQFKAFHNGKEPFSD